MAQPNWKWLKSPDTLLEQADQELGERRIRFMGDQHFGDRYRWSVHYQREDVGGPDCIVCDQREATEGDCCRQCAADNQE